MDRREQQARRVKTKEALLATRVCRIKALEVINHKLKEELKMA
jgi:hypothetical protein